jgi:hypothetical protein
MSVEIIRWSNQSKWLAFKRRFIYPFKWFYQRNIWCLGFRLHCVRIFASAVWHFDTCDYAPTLRLMQIGFREMSRLHKEHGHVTDSHRIARRTLIVSELCRRLEEDNYETLAGYARYEQMNEKQRQQWATHTTYLAQQDADYLGRMLKNVRC